ncbi:FAD-binding protein, partial [Thermodesulfobacteriota bacterium]
MNRVLKTDSSLHCDLLIIGAGGAGLRCAAEVLEKRPETRVIALTKVPHPQQSHTATAQGGLAAVDPADPADKTIYHMFDTWKGSDCTADQNIIQKISEASWEQIIWLENRGMHFSRNNEGKLSKRTFGGHTLNFGERSAYRAVFEADRTGKGIMDTTWGESIKRGISFLNQCVATELLFDDEQCVGCIAFRQKEGEFVRILSKATVVATGGCGQVFKITTNCRQNTG